MGIFVVRADGQLVEMEERQYELEKVLQGRLAEYPDLLVSRGLESSGGKQYVLVKREVGLPSAEGAANRWSVDHLFLDEEGIPTLVEVKRSSNTQIRREVVGQILDYAANAIAFWPVERIRADFEANSRAKGQDPDTVLAPLLRENEDSETYWQRVKTNLEAQRLRLVFVADEIPVELKQIVEYLNGQMRSTEVLAVEVKEFEGEGLTTMVSQVIGRTAAAQQAKGTGPPSERQALYLEFWSELLPELQRLVPGWLGSKSASTNSYLTLRSGHAGSSYALVFTGDRRLRVELYISLKDQASSKKRFAHFEAQRESIESRMGAGLAWEELPDRKASRIGLYSDGFTADIEDREEWPTYREWFLKNLERFRQAIQPALDELPSALDI